MLHNKLGNTWEKRICRLLNKSGKAKRLSIGNGGDISYNGLMIEVKACNFNGNYAQFCAYKSGHTDCKNSVIVIAVVIIRKNYYYYAIPSSEITGKTVKLNPFGKSKYNRYLTTQSAIINGEFMGAYANV